MPRKQKLQDAVNTPGIGTPIEPLSGGIVPPPAGSDQAPDPPPAERNRTGTNAPSGIARVVGKTKRELPCILTSGELAEKSQQLAKSFDEIAVMSAHHKQTIDDLKGQMKAATRRQSELAQTVQLGQEKRFVEIEITLLGDNETVSERRLDTGAPLGTRPARPEERQSEMFNSQTDHLFDGPETEEPE